MREGKTRRPVRGLLIFVRILGVFLPGCVDVWVQVFLAFSLTKPGKVTRYFQTRKKGVEPLPLPESDRMPDRVSEVANGQNWTELREQTMPRVCSKTIRITTIRFDDLLCMPSKPFTGKVKPGFGVRR